LGWLGWGVVWVGWGVGVEPVQSRVIALVKYKDSSFVRSELGLSRPLPAVMFKSKNKKFREHLKLDHLLTSFPVSVIPKNQQIHICDENVPF
jgi:hypothetical protein